MGEVSVLSNLEVLTKISLVVNILNSTLLAILFIYLKFNVEKKLKKYEIDIDDIAELNKKTHDLMVLIEELINNARPISKIIKTRVYMNASRLEKYNPDLANDMRVLVYSWNLQYPTGTTFNVLTPSLQENLKRESLAKIGSINSKVDKLLR